jgi:hypothetical protein
MLVRLQALEMQFQTKLHNPAAWVRDQPGPYLAAKAFGLVFKAAAREVTGAEPELQ